MTDELVVVTTTAPDGEVADRLARELVERGAAACVQRSPIRSTYRWHGQVHDEDEVLLVVKTVRDRVADVAAVVDELHPYELPELVVTPAGASDPYGAWVVDQVGGAGRTSAAGKATGSTAPSEVRRSR